VNLSRVNSTSIDTMLLETSLVTAPDLGHVCLESVTATCISIKHFSGLAMAPDNYF